MVKTRRSPKGRSGRKAPPTAKSKWVPVFVLALLSAAVLGYFLFPKKGPDAEKTEQPAQAVNAGEPTQGKDASALGSDAERLIGRWTRPDGGYIIEVRNIDASGRADAGYYNPRPINVSQAILARKNKHLELFIELRDEGYPGSTYTLVYDAQRDLLAGVYFQAAMNQSFDVIFLRSR